MGSDYRYDVGDTVRIREWDDMLAEYGLSRMGKLYITPDRIDFSDGMRGMCGREYEIVSRYIHPAKGCERYKLKGEGFYVFSPGMFARDASDEQIDVDAFLSIIL